MCRTHYALTLVVLYAGLSSCEFPTAQELQFHSNRVFNEENLQSEFMGFIEKVIYDVVSDRVIFLDNFNPHGIIFCYDRRTQRTESLVPRKYREKIVDIDLDLAKGILFWIEDDSIYQLSLNSELKNSFRGKLFIEMNGLKPRAIAVDSCNGYIYWTATDQLNRTTPSVIEKARLDGSGREIVINSSIQMPQLLVVTENEFFWTDGTLREDRLPTKEKQFSIQSINLYGHRRTVYRETGEDQPQYLGVAEEAVYWSYFFRPGVWRLDKYPSENSKPLQILNATVQDLTTNFTITQLFLGIHNCENLSNLKNIMGTVFYRGDDMMTNGVNDIKISAEYQCKCASCSVCQNYCFQGNCSVTAEGQPKCRCKTGFSGVRCEVNLCQGYCLNDGNCSLDKENKTVCECKGDYEGDRCEVPKCLNRLNKHLETVAMLRDVLNQDVTSGFLDRGVESTCAATDF
ncbi:hypothetical protein PYW08_013627 [Mythimna loreyi]|uniref:Uncharacterized protein n=1 Tax=Mythimna loreyi TaxID=667449 RepID=A0ACC2QHB2_9NEOP|nr:hypothetical protein PYW08_013627 [Mythimna loreyi]